MKEGCRFDYKRFVEDYFARLGWGSCPADLYQLKTILANFSKPAKGVSPEVFFPYLRIPVIDGPDGGKLREKHKKRMRIEYAERLGYYGLDRKIKPIMDQTSEVFRFCQDEITGPIAKKHIQAMQAQWEENKAAFAAKYRIKDRDHFISVANKRLKSKRSPNSADPPQDCRNPESDGSQGSRVTWDLGE